MKNEVIRNVAEFPIGIEEAKELRSAKVRSRKVFAQIRDADFMRPFLALTININSLSIC